MPRKGSNYVHKMNSNDHFFLAYLFDSMRSAPLGSAKSRFLLDEDGCSLRLSIHYLTRQKPVCCVSVCKYRPKPPPQPGKG